MTTTRMVADVSDLARFDEGATLKTKFEPTNLREVGLEAIEAIQFNALRMSGGDDGVSVSLDLVGGGLAVMRIDRGVLLRVLAHLLENAVREVDSGGQVTLRITSSSSTKKGVDGDGHTVLVEVIDDGKGLPVGTCLDQGDDLITGGDNNKQAPVHRYTLGRGKLSDDPDQILKARTKMEDELRDLKQNGVGVGLPLSYHLVRSLGGDLRYDNQWSKKGTRIWFALPSITEGDNVMEVEDMLKTETIPKKGIQPPASITLDFNEKVGHKRRRISETDFANFSSDGSTSSETAGTTVTPASSMALEPAPEAVAKCGVKASMPFSVLIVEDTDICKFLHAGLSL